MVNKLKDIIAGHFFEGAVLILMGLVMLLFPGSAKKYISVILGAILVVIGALLLIAFINRKGLSHPLELFGGLLSVALGLEMIISPSTFIVVVQVVLSITLVYSSILLNLQAYILRNQRGTLFVMTVVFAIAAVAFAAVMLIKPLGVERIFIQVKGASLVLEGLAALFIIRTHASSESIM